MTNGLLPSVIGEHDRRRILLYVAISAALFTAIVATGLTLLMAVGDEGAGEALYRTLGAFTTASTVEAPDSEVEKAVSAGLSIAGGLYYLFLVGFVVREVAIRKMFSEGWQLREQRRRIGRMKDHFIVCGYGNVGRAVSRVLLQHGHSVVVVDLKQENIDAAREHARLVDRETQLVGILGEASHLEILKHANIESASALIACVGTDGENLFIALTARQGNEQIRVIARAADDEGAARLASMKPPVDAVCDPYSSAGKEIAKLAEERAG